MLSLRRDGDGFSVTTDQGDWHAAQVVIATGWCDRPHVPYAAIGLSSSVAQLTPSTYRNPDQLPKGGVLVVGASASGVQLADELARAGRHVALAASATPAAPPGSTSAGPASPRSSGPPASSGPTPGSTCRSWTARARSASAGA